MRCAATLESGRPCDREAEPDGEVCSYHRRIELRRQARRFYTARLSAEEHQALALAGQLEGVDAEIAILRVLIRRGFTLGDIDAARRGIESLWRILKPRYEMDERATNQLAGSLERVLDTLGQEIEAAL